MSFFEPENTVLVMNYIDLIEAIKTRPKFFLRDENIYELDAFVRGVSYANFVEKSDTDTFRTFTDDWIPNNFKNHRHDWVETITQLDERNDPFSYFFTLWDNFLIDYERKRNP